MKRFGAKIVWLFVAVLGTSVLLSTEFTAGAANMPTSSANPRYKALDLPALDNGTSTLTPTVSPTATRTRTLTPTRTRTPEAFGSGTATAILKTLTRTSTPAEPATGVLDLPALLTLTAPQTVAPSLTVTGSLTMTAALTVTASPTVSSSPAVSGTQTITATSSATTTPTVGPSPTATGTPTITPTPSPTPYRYPLSLDANVLAITSLRSRPYGGGAIKITRTVSDEKRFKRTLFEYQSDGLRITGMMNIPQGIGPFPVVILDHGYFAPAEYNSGDGTVRAADVFATSGYLTLAPDYRCYAGSQCAANTIDVGYAIDVLNLIADLPSLPNADPTHVGIWGHSMGGGVTMRVLAVDPGIKAAALYGAVSSDDEVHYCWLAGCRSALVTPVPRTSFKLDQFDQDFNQGLPTPVADSPTDYRGKLHEVFLRSSPSRYLQDIYTPIIIHHGEADDTVPIQWSVDLADQLTALGKRATLYTYPGENHVFAGWGWQLFMSRTLSFFDSYLNPRATPITVDKRVQQQERVASETNY
ncbi:MAG TPA: alpha/beta fold hydrolase [Anaerolineae bacterium]